MLRYNVQIQFSNWEYRGAKSKYEIRYNARIFLDSGYPEFKLNKVKNSYAVCYL